MWILQNQSFQILLNKLNQNPGASIIKIFPAAMEQNALKNVNICLNANIYSYLETPGGQCYNLYLNVVHFFNTSVN